MGLLDILVGVILVANLGVTAATLPMIFALWCLAVGVIQLVTSFQLRKIGAPWGWSLGIGILGILFAFMILIFPSIGAVTITTLMGMYIICTALLPLPNMSMRRGKLFAAFAIVGKIPKSGV